MSHERLHRIRRHYEARLAADRESYDILDWSSREAQQARFAALLRVLRAEFAPGDRPWLLDVGCGLTDLASFLEAAAFPVRYLGADITLGLLAEARRRHPGRALLAGDVFAATPLRSRAVDVCYCSGVFNLNLGNNDAFAAAALPRLVDLSRAVAVANFLHRRTPHQYPHCHYFDPERLIRSMTARGLEVDLLDDYLENDFTLVLRRPGPG